MNVRWWSFGYLVYLASFSSIERFNKLNLFVFIKETTLIGYSMKTLKHMYSSYIQLTTNSIVSTKSFPRDCKEGLLILKKV